MDESKKGIKGVIFGRTIIVILAFLIQMLVLFSCFLWLRDDVFYVYGGFTLLSAVVIIYLVNKRGNPDFKLVWMIPILVLPVFGTLLYVYIELQPGTRVIYRRLQYLGLNSKKYIKQDIVVQKNLNSEDLGAGYLSSYLKEYGNFPVYQNTSVKYFPLGEDKFREMLVQLKAAKKFIFLEYFIVEEGMMWGSILDILKVKVTEGVEVRFLYDGMCTLALLPFSYPKEIERLGIKCKMFAPIRPLFSTHYNNRDHRKILVIDGETAFTGGVNLADEYINQKERFGHWKDTAIMLKGDAVERFTFMFLEMWGVGEKEEEEYEKYLTPKSLQVPSDGYIIPYGASPFGNERTGKRVYLDILNTARKYVHIMTPYLILDHEMIMALTYAAKRGVEVVIIMPFVPDKKTAFALAKSHYNELLEAGVHIYEYTPGFIHAKVFISDHKKAVVGTINLDYRSLYLHFECAAYLYRNSEIFAIEEDFQETLKMCKKIAPSDYAKLSFFTRAQGRVLRLFAPLM